MKNIAFYGFAVFAIFSLYLMDVHYKHTNDERFAQAIEKQKNEEQEELYKTMTEDELIYQEWLTNQGEGSTESLNVAQKEWAKAH